MMLMKSPAGGTSTGGGFSREVVFKLTVAPDPSAAAVSKSFGDGMTQIQNRVAGTAQLRAKDIAGFYRSAFDDVLRHGTSVFEALSMKSRQMTQQMASDWANSMRGVGGGVSGGAGSAVPGGGSRFSMNMGALASSRPPAWTPSPWPAMGGPSAWAPPASMMGLGAGMPAWQTSHSYPSFAGSPADAVGGGGGSGGGGSATAGRFFSGFNGLLTGGSQLARGAVYSGLAGEKDSQKVLEILLRIEGALGLIHGAIAVGRGLNVLGVPAGVAGAGVAAAASVGWAAYSIYGLSQDSRARNLGNQTQRATGWAIGANLYGWGEDDSQGDEADKAWRGFHRGVRRADRQEKYLESMKQVGATDREQAGRAFAENDLALELGMRGKRTDAQKEVELRKALAREQAHIVELVNNEADAMKRNGGAAKEQTDLRLEGQRRAFNLEEQIRDVRIKGEKEANSLALSRAQHVAEASSKRLGEQIGLAQGDATRYRSDVSRYGAMNPLEKMRLQSAVMAFRSGRATTEQEDMLSGFNEFGDAVEAARARRGMMDPGSGIFSGGAAAAKASELATRGAKAIDAAAKLDVITKHVIEIKQAKDEGKDTRQAEMLLEFMKEMFDKQDRDYAKKLDDLRREMNGQQRAKNIIAGR